MTPIYLHNYKSLVEQKIMQLLQLAFQRRIPASPVANQAALAALDVSAIADGDLCYVTDVSRVYQYGRHADAGVAPSVIPAAYPSARWVASTLPASYGPNWRAPLLSKSTGALKAVQLFAGEDATSEKFARIMAATPSLMLEHRADSTKPLSVGYPGSHYQVDALYTCTIFSDNNRGSPWSSWGSPTSVSETSDAGPAAIIGELRKVCAGLRGVDLGLGGTDDEGIDGSVERIEIGDSRLVDEEYAERFLIWEADLQVRLYVWNPDLDLDAMIVDVQPRMADSPPPVHIFAQDMAALAEGEAVKYVLQNFDPLNYVAAGLIVPVPSPASLTSTPVSGTAMIAGSSCAVTGAAHTFTAARDTYRDLVPDGVGGASFTYVPVRRGAPAPALTANGFRVGLTVTDDTGIVSDRYLCSYSSVYRPRYQVIP